MRASSHDPFRTPYYGHLKNNPTAIVGLFKIKTTKSTYNKGKFQQL